MDCAKFVNTNTMGEKIAVSYVAYCLKGLNYLFNKIMVVQTACITCVTTFPLFRDKESLRFIKYVNSRLEKPFHDLQLTYYE